MPFCVVADAGRQRRAARPNRETTPAGRRPLERAAERRDRQDDELGRRSSAGQRLRRPSCSFCAAASSSPTIWALRSRRASIWRTSASRGGGRLRRPARPPASRRPAAPAARAVCRSSDACRGVQPGDRRGERLHPALIDLRQRRHDARARGRCPGQVADAEQHARVAGPARACRPPPAGRSRPGAPRRSPRRACSICRVVFVDLRGHRRGLGVEPAGLLEPQVALDLERAEVAEQRALLAGQRLGLAVERRDPLGGARRAASPVHGC